MWQGPIGLGFIVGFADRGRFVLSVAAVLAGLLAIAAALVLSRGDDGLFALLLGLGATTLGALGVAHEFLDRESGPIDAVQPPKLGTALTDPVAIPVVGGDDTITVNVFHLLRASWATTIDLPDGTSFVAGADGDVLKVRDNNTGRIIRARIDASGAVSVSSASEAPIIASVFVALADQLLGAGLSYEPSVTVQAEPSPAIPVGSG